MTLRLGILGNPSNWYVCDLLRAAQAESTQAVLLSFPEMFAGLFSRQGASSMAVSQLHLGASAERTDLLGAKQQPDLDALLVRNMPLGSLEQVVFRMDCLRGWQAEGIQVVNSPSALETCIDKWLTLHRLYLHGIAVPPTVVCQTRTKAMEAFDRLDRDVLVKPLFGGEGRGIIRLTDVDLAWRAFSTLQQLGQVAYVQKFIPNTGYDIRVFVLGDSVHSIRRNVRPGEYRSNVSQGGLAVPHELTEPERLLALRAASAVEGTILGVDLLPGADGQLWVLEVNAVPGWRALGQVLGIDIARRIIKQLVRSCDRPQSAAEMPCHSKPLEMT